MVVVVPARVEWEQRAGLASTVLISLFSLKANNIIVIELQELNVVLPILLMI